MHERTQSRRVRRYLLFAVLIVILLQATAALAGTKSFFFLHHSTGRNLMNQGDVRNIIGVLSSYQQTQLTVWDHDYNHIGLRDPDDQYTGYSYEIPNDNTDPDGLYELWTTENAARDSILARYDVIAFKSCYHPTCQIVSDDQLQQYKDWYLEIREVLVQYPLKLFVIMSPPPLHNLVTEQDWADRSRAFANWLGSEEFLGDYDNLVFFDFFDLLANPDDGQPMANMLRYEYEITHDTPNGHPNELANSIIGPQFANFVVVAANRMQDPTDVPDVAAALELKAFPNPFNPRTTISFTLPSAQSTRVDIYDLTGRHVRTLHQGHLAEGAHQMAWTGRDEAGNGVPSGTYFAKVQIGDGSATTALTLLK